MSIKKERIDKVLVDRGLATTRARAQAMILAGNILLGDESITKAGTLIDPEAEIRLKEPELSYVSRGALKIKAALQQFGILPSGKNAIDIGASTGGFTEVLLEKGAARVYAVDVGTNQLAWKIRSHPQVTVKEKYNARFLEPKDFECTFDLLVMDVSFISIRLILPAVLKVMNPGADLAVLFKPQFELGREWIGDGGIVKDQQEAKRNLTDLIEWSETLGLKFVAQMDSPITGTDGNHEYLIHWRKD